ncbi:hypothetical protein SADUNF_Sadunf15G0068300 [Salix dunnii]|uniref:Uncharacterized protein n=1 Tax=Salix dunnii TaxID=1413687 RepID=A0A835JED9_9ROSI|nr:hypothetical protein SADUNF_Sadunf15G0068300 [Salix dunnii]
MNLMQTKSCQHCCILMPIEVELHQIKVPLINQATSSSSKEDLILDPITPAPIPPSKAHVVTPSPSQTKRQLLFEDEIPLKSSAIDAISGTPNIIISLDCNASTISKADDPPMKRQCPPKPHHD